MTDASVKETKAGHVPELPHGQSAAAELPCNVFGTVDRCDGMGCEHDGNCFSGCCSIFVSGESKRCMPLVNGDMCPIAIDVVEQLQSHTAQEHTDVDEPIEDDHPIMEKGEHHDVFEELQEPHQFEKV